MKLTLNNDVFAVIDDFLEPSDFDKIWNFIQTEQFKFVHSSRWVNAFSLEDGAPLWGNVTISHSRPEPCTTELIYPTNTTIDLFINELRLGTKMIFDVSVIKFKSDYNLLKEEFKKRE